MKPEERCRDLQVPLSACVTLPKVTLDFGESNTLGTGREFRLDGNGQGGMNVAISLMGGEEF